MANILDETRYEVALANRIVANEGVLDAFGHISARHPTDPGRYLLSRSRSPELVEPADVLEYTLDSEPVKPPTVNLYSERVIHGCIYEARDDVGAVSHHHSPTIMPFAIAGVEIYPVYHLGAIMGATAPFWDSYDDFGDTNLLVATREQGQSLARGLGKHDVVMMRRHGATAVGTDLRNVVFRTIYMSRNAEYQLKAMALGTAGRLYPGEIEMAGALHKQPNVVSRAWEYWCMRLDKAGGTPPRPGRAVAGARVASKAAAKSKSKARRRLRRRQSPKPKRRQRLKPKPKPKPKPASGGDKDNSSIVITGLARSAETR